MKGVDHKLALKIFLYSGLLSSILTTLSFMSAK